MYKRKTFGIHYDGYVYYVVLISRNVFNGCVTNRKNICFYNYEEEAEQSLQFLRTANRIR